MSEVQECTPATSLVDREPSNESASAWLSTVKPFTPWRRANSADENGLRKAPRNDSLAIVASPQHCRSAACLDAATRDRRGGAKTLHLSTIVSTSSMDGLLEQKLLLNAEGRDATARAQSSEHGINTARCKPQFSRNVARLAGVHQRGVATRRRLGTSVNASRCPHDRRPHTLAHRPGPESEVRRSV